MKSLQLTLFLSLISFASGCRTVLTKEEHKKWIADHRAILTVDNTFPEKQFRIEYYPTETELYDAYLPDRNGEKFVLTISVNPDPFLAKRFDAYTRTFMPLNLLLVQGENKIRCSNAVPDTSFASIGCLKADLTFDGIIQDNNEPIEIHYNDNLFGCGSMKFLFNKLIIAELPALSNRPLP